MDCLECRGEGTAGSLVGSLVKVAGSLGGSLAGSLVGVGGTAVVGEGSLEGRKDGSLVQDDGS